MRMHALWWHGWCFKCECGKFLLARDVDDARSEFAEHAAEVSRGNSARDVLAQDIQDWQDGRWAVPLGIKPPTATAYSLADYLLKTGKQLPEDERKS
jgi:hypothetical protein